MKNITLSLLAGAVLGLLAAAPATAAPGDLGNDMAGEACRLAGSDILCGATQVKTGSLHQLAMTAALPAGDAARRGAIAAAIRALPGNDSAAGLRCDGGKGVDATTFLYSCSSGNGDAPRVVLASLTPRMLFMADGLPGMIDVLSAAITAQPGGAVSGAAAASSAVKAQFSRQVLNARANDYSGYLQLRAAGSQAAARGNYPAAEQAYRDALDIETRLFGPDSAAVGATLLELALQVSNQQRFDEAAALFRRATPIIEAAPSPEIRARFDSYRGLDAANQRHYEEALRYARQDTAARQAAVDAVRNGGLDLNGNPPVVSSLLEGELAHALRVQAVLELRNGNVSGALASAQQALLIISAHPDLPLAWRADMVSVMGEINAQQGRVATADHDYNDALSMNRKLFGETGPTIQAELALGRFYSEQQIYPSAITAYRQAFASLAKDPLARSQVVADQLIPFLNAANASLQGPDRVRLEQEMFAASQMSDDGVTGQTIARMAARRAAETPALAAEVRAADDAVRARDEARMALAEEHAKSNDDRNAVRETALAAQADTAATKADQLAAKLRTDFPAYAGLADPGAVSLDAMRRTLHPHEAFASFMVGVHSAYVLLVTQDGLAARPIQTNADGLAADITALREAFVPKLGKLPDFSLANANALYRQTLGPVEAQLAGVDHLTVAVNGDLASLPFSLLVTAAPSDPRDYVHAAWLIRQTAVSEIPSARAFMALRGEARVAQSRPFLGIGNPVFQGGGANQALAMSALASACQTGGPADPALLRALQPLPETAAEVQAVGRDLGASPDDILLGASASEAGLRAKPLDQYAVLYFATHGMLPGELHCQAQPGLVLSPPPAMPQSTADDGLLTASEIADLKINANLVVLSACNTGAEGGARFGGGALEGLADAFFNAGAHAVLASHWEVPSSATQALMTSTFAALAKDPNHDAAEALRQAQLALIAQEATAHPFDWAAFTLIGGGA
ncbi:MAG TPA: CHAT domain-containing tetratricopeptide repeat protein [Rhizomicrobium sp.]|jgi:CHAT domain-containing protein|nr:CHAT domain-containing tetratricopeptide repeat protein [Rhizomicrobium sp.]